MSTILLAAFLVLLGAITLILGVRLGRDCLHLLRHGRRVPGSIVEVTVVENTSAPTSYYPAFEFKGADDAMHRVVAANGTPFKQLYKAGQMIEVVYLPGREKDAIMHSGYQSWVAPLLCCGFAIFLFCAAFYMIANRPHP